MKVDMVMPKMGESITEGTIVRWIKNEGDTVLKDEIVLEISTDKVDSEIPVPVPGTLLEILIHEGETVEVGTPIALIETDQVVEEVKSVEPEEKSAQSTDNTKQTIEIPKQSGKNSASLRFISPVVMNIATENDISMTELESISGSGLNERVTKKDILKYIEGIESKPGLTGGFTSPSLEDDDNLIEIIPMDHVRKSIARHMIESKQTSAHVNIYSEVDLHNVVKIRENNKSHFENKEGFKLTYLPFIVEATVKSLKEFPILNASIDGENIIIKKQINLGIAVSVDYGLIVPNIFDAGALSLSGLAGIIQDLAVRARQKKLKPDEVQNGTFSISNFGIYGTTIGFPIINQPQVAILGVGALKKKPVVINDAIAIRPMMYLSLTFDHRLIDGATGAQFLQRICQNLEAYDSSMQL